MLALRALYFLQEADMKATFLAVCALLFLFTLCLPGGARAFKETPSIPLKAPTGWKTEVQEGITVMTPGDVGKDKVYVVMITPLKDKAGSLTEVFKTGEKLIAEVGVFKAAGEAKQAETEGGWSYKFALGTVDKQGNAFLAQVMALKKGDVGAVVLVLTDSVVTMEKYADAFGAMVRDLGVKAAKPVAPTSGKADLQYTTPPGWTTKQVNGFLTLQKVRLGNSVQTLLILPSEPLKGSLREAFRSYWKAYVSDHYETTIAPLPMVARLHSGYACAYDADISAKYKGARVKAALYLIAQGGRVVPILSSVDAFVSEPGEDIEQLLQSARIPGASAAKVPLFSAPEIAGDWGTTSSTMADYVNYRGDYAGDASITTAYGFTLASNGTFKTVFIGLTGTVRIRERDEGKWKVEDGDLILQGKETRKFDILGYGSDSKVGRYLVLGNYANIKEKVNFANPRGLYGGKWLKSK
jgi:hypothetical protein